MTHNSLGAPRSFSEAIGMFGAMMEHAANLNTYANPTTHTLDESQSARAAAFGQMQHVNMDNFTTEEDAAFNALANRTVMSEDTRLSNSFARDVDHGLGSGKSPRDAVFDALSNIGVTIERGHSNDDNDASSATPGAGFGAPNDPDGNGNFDGGGSTGSDPIGSNGAVGAI